MHKANSGYNDIATVFCLSRDTCFFNIESAYSFPHSFDRAPARGVGACLDRMDTVIAVCAAQQCTVQAQLGATVDLTGQIGHNRRLCMGTIIFVK